MMVTNQNYIHNEIKSRLNLGNPCYHAVQGLVPFFLILPEHIKVKISSSSCSSYTTIWVHWPVLRQLIKSTCHVSPF
jgi:hypothetical protein